MKPALLLCLVSALLLLSCGGSGGGETPAPGSDADVIGAAVDVTPPDPTDLVEPDDTSVAPPEDGVDPPPDDAWDGGPDDRDTGPPDPADATDDASEEDVPGPPPPLGVDLRTEIPGPFRTCEHVKLIVDAVGPRDVPPDVDWEFVSFPPHPVFVFEPVKDHVVVVSCAPGTYTFRVRALYRDTPHEYVEDELDVTFELLPDANGDGLGDTCADVDSGVMLTGVLEPTTLLTCQRRTFVATGETVGSGHLTFTWELVHRPSLAEFDWSAQGPFLELMAATPGRYGFTVTACAPTEPEAEPRCRAEDISVTVAAAPDFEGVWIDERCAPSVGEDTHLHFTLPFEGAEQTAGMELLTALEIGDVVFNMDATGSMDSSIEALKDSLESSIIPRMAARINDVAVAVTSFRDVPSGWFGDSSDWPYRLEQRVTRRAADARLAVAELDAGGGGDGPESGFEALYQIATGHGRQESPLIIPAFDPGQDYVQGIADGAQGGVGFRQNGTRVVIQITDAPAHSADESDYGFGATREETYAVLESRGIRVMGVLSGSDTRAHSDLQEMATRTGARVPPCAWDDVRPAACAPGLCCTGVDGAGQSTDGSGRCPLVFGVPSGDGIDESVVSGVQALLAGSTLDVTYTLYRDEEEFAFSAVDTTCFVAAIVPLEATALGCADSPTTADFDDDGVLDGFAGVAPGSTLSFEIRAQNDCVRQDKYHQVFTATLDVVASDGTGLGSRILVFIVPPLGG